MCVCWCPALAYDVDGLFTHKIPNMFCVTVWHGVDAESVNGFVECMVSYLADII